MLGSINPLGERARQRRWGMTVAWYVVGSTLGGTLAGAVMGAFGQAVGLGAVSWTTRTSVLAGIAAVGLLFDLRLFGLSLPSIHRQVNKEWLNSYRSWVYGLGFGIQLGLGVVTIVTTSAVYVWLVAALLSASPWVAAFIGATFGLARALPIALGSRIARAEDLARLAVRLEGSQRTSRRLAMGAQLVAIACVGVYLVL